MNLLNAVKNIISSIRLKILEMRLKMSIFFLNSICLEIYQKKRNLVSDWVTESKAINDLKESQKLVFIPIESDCVWLTG